jgi:hypothetical protein
MAREVLASSRPLPLRSPENRQCFRNLTAARLQPWRSIVPALAHTRCPRATGGLRCLLAWRGVNLTQHEPYRGSRPIALLIHSYWDACPGWADDAPGLAFHIQRSAPPRDAAETLAAAF